MMLYPNTVLPDCYGIRILCGGRVPKHVVDTYVPHPSNIVVF